MQLDIDRLVAYFGGVNALAEALKQHDPENAATTAAIYKWRTRGSLPLAQLQKLTGWDIINGGISGDTSAQALSRLPALLQRQPKLVIIGIGGNDFLRKFPEAETRANIAKIIEGVQKENIPAVLVGVPHLSVGALFGHLSDHPLYQELAEQYKIPLFGDAWSEILSDEKLKSDQIHANAAGYKAFAEKLEKFLQEEGFL